MSLLQKLVKASCFFVAFVGMVFMVFCIRAAYIASAGQSPDTIWLYVSGGMVSYSVAMLTLLHSRFVGLNTAKARNRQPLQIKYVLQILGGIGIGFLGVSFTRMAQESDAHLMYLGLSDLFCAVTAFLSVVAFFVFNPAELEIEDMRTEKEKRKRTVRLTDDGEILEEPTTEDHQKIAIQELKIDRSQSRYRPTRDRQ